MHARPRQAPRHARHRRPSWLRRSGVAALLTVAAAVLASCGSDMPATPDPDGTSEDPVVVSQCVSAA